MPFDDALIGTNDFDPRTATENLIRSQSDDTLPSVLDPRALTTRMARKLGKKIDAETAAEDDEDVSAAPSPPKQAELDFSSQASPPSPVATAQTDAPDFSAQAIDPKATPAAPPVPLGVSGNLIAAAKGIPHGAVESTGKVMSGIGQAQVNAANNPQIQAVADENNLSNQFAGMLSPEELARTQAQEKADADAAKNPANNTLLQAGKATQQAAQTIVPMTDQEKESLGGQVGTGIGSIAPYAVATAIDPALGIAAGFTGMAASTYSDVYEQAKKAGASEEKAQQAANWSALTAGTLGSLPLGAGKLVSSTWAKIAASGATFAGLGEAQDALLQEIAKETYDPKAGYSPDAKRIMAQLIVGGLVGGVHAVADNARAGAQQTAPSAGAAPANAGALPPGSPPGAGPRSSPEDIADFVKQARAGNRTQHTESDTSGATAAPDPGQMNDADLAQAFQQARDLFGGASLDDILKQGGWMEGALDHLDDRAKVVEAVKVAREKASGTGKFAEQGEAAPEQPQASQEGPKQEGLKPEAPVSHLEYAVLREYGYSDEDIRNMSATQRKREVQDAYDEGIKPGEAMMKHKPPEQAAQGAPETPASAAEAPSGKRDAPITPQTAEDVARAQPVEPKSPAQAEAENYQHAHVEMPHIGLEGDHSISIETGMGQERKGIDANGKEWSVKLEHAAYGRIKGTKGADGQPLDVFVGPSPKSSLVFIIDQHDPATGKFDEHKIMAGFYTPIDALHAYSSAYNDGGKGRIGNVTALTAEQFKAWLKTDTTKPLRAESPAPPVPIAAETEGTGALSTEADGVSKGATPPVPKETPAKAGSEAETTTPEDRSKPNLEPSVEAVEAHSGHYDAIEAALGTDADKVAHVDIARAAEILAENEGITPEAAFGQAVIENAVEGGFLTEQEAVQAYGQEAKDILEPGTEGTSGSSSDAGAQGASPNQERSGGAAEAGELPGRGEAGGKEAGGTEPAEQPEKPAAHEAEGEHEPVPGERAEPEAAEHEPTGRNRTAGNEARNAAEEGTATAPAAEPERLSSKVVDVYKAGGKTEMLEDAGEKIGGARKDAWGSGGLNVSDLGQMTEEERKKNLTKGNIFKQPDWEQAIADGVEPVAAALMKRMYDRLPVKPNLDRWQGAYEKDEAKADAIFIGVLKSIRGLFQLAKTVSDVKAIANKADGKIGYSDIGIIFAQGGRVNPLRVGWKDERAAKEAVEHGFPNMAPWTRLFEIKHHVFGIGDGAKSQFGLYRKNGGLISRHETKPEAEAAAKEAYDKLGEERKQGGEEPKRPHLDHVERSGPDYRKGRDVTGDDFIKDFGFRGVEFGNWVASDERQKSVNFAYDALHDLARVLNVPPKALSLDGTLAVAFGARGRGGKAAAHYEPGRRVINLTKLSGAGTLAHEYGHALDHYLGWFSGEDAEPAKGKFSYNKFLDANSRMPHALPIKLRAAVNRLMHDMHEAEEDDEQFDQRKRREIEAAKGSQNAWIEHLRGLRERKAKGQSASGMKQAETQVEVWGRKIKAIEAALTTGRKKTVPTRYLTEASKLSGPTGNYWKRPTEMLARAFEAYVHDRIKDEGFESQYLVQGVEPNRFGNGFRGNPYPAGEERERINADFDRVFRAIEAGEGKLGAGTRLQGMAGEPEPVAETEKVNRPQAHQTGAAEAKAVEESPTLAGAFERHFVDGKGFAGILEARKFAKEKGFPEDAKAVEEAIEAAIVRTARGDIETSHTPESAYKALVNLYQRQPRLGTRTSTSIRDQAYSTPVPLAYVAARLADITHATSVYEPTGGNGALLITADPSRTSVNEINPERRASLRDQGFKPMDYDASTETPVNQIDAVDRVIANPPFGPVKADNGENRVFDLSDADIGGIPYRTSEIHHAIAIRALDAMKDDGKAVLILGGVNKLVTTEKGRADAYQGKAKREFFKAIYDAYGVTDHFTVNGDLYERQGAGWPVDVIVIKGRRKSRLPLPSVKPPRIYNTWDELGGLLNGQPSASDVRPTEAENRPAAGGNVGLEGVGGADRGRAGGNGTGTAEPVSVRGEPGAEIAGTGARGGEAGNEPGRSGQSVERAGAGEQPAAVEDFDAAFDAALDHAFGPVLRTSQNTAEKQPQREPAGAGPRPTSKIAKETINTGVKAADEAFSALYDLFGGSKASSGFTFDEDTYRKAKPHFEAAASAFGEFKNNLGELLKRMVAHMRDALKWPREVMEKIRPYLKRFIEEMRAGPEAEPARKQAIRNEPTETENQVVYKPQSKVKGLDTLIPVNMAKPTFDALKNLETRVGQIDTFVANELGYKPQELEKYFGAEQVDALGLAIDNIKRGKGFIIGDQCVAGETLIYDPLFDRHVRIDELADASVPHAVLALTADGFVPHAAVATFKKGRADLYRVTLEDGRSIVITQQHRFLTPQGWASIEDGVCSGTLLAIAQDADTNSLATRGACDPRASRKPQDCLDDCLSGLHPYGEPPQTDGGIDPIVAQLRDDALEHILASSHRDGPEPSPEYSPPSPAVGHHSKRSFCPSESRGRDASAAYAFASGERLTGWTPRSEQRSERWSGTCSAADGEVLKFSPSPRANGSMDAAARQRISDDSKSSPPSPCGASQAPAPSAPSGSRTRLLPAWSPVRSIEFVRHDDFYDLYVPGPENYVAQGFVNHNTGIGKGRVNAAIIRYAIKQGRVPVFITEKPGLYKDMFRDMMAIGMSDGFLDDKPRILATNAALNLPLEDGNGARLKTGDAKTHNAHMMTVLPEFDKHYDMVFSTYNQMQTQKGEDTARRRFLQSLANQGKGVVLIFDESHNGGGQKGGRKNKDEAEDRAAFVRGIIQKANGVFYSSATYAKRPDVMDLYAATDMAMAVDNLEDLADAISRGGVPMQQAVASMLSKAGQYIRRERSFDGINYNTPSVPVDRKMYDGIAQALSSIQDFSKIMKASADKMDAEIRGEGAAMGHDAATGDAGAQSVNFTAVMHNVINQMLLASKADEAANRAIAAIKNGEKPVLTVANTMEAFLQDYSDNLGLNRGDEMKGDFSHVLQKYLDRTRIILIRKPFQKKGEGPTRKYLTDDELGPGALAAYNATKKLIAGLDLKALPLSPIDYIKGKLKAAGYDMGEITGRTLMVDYSNKVPTFETRPGSEKTTAGKVETLKRFNTRPKKGGYHALLINQSGSTGLSAHASVDFDDQSKRRMIIVQPEANIDTHMQLLGRINRTGQVVLPEYDQLVLDAPAEKRPAAVLAKKMASLNANTTASRSSAVTAKDVPDFINQYGDAVAAAWVLDNAETHWKLAAPIKIDESGKPDKVDAMRKLTGRIPLLRLEQQEQVYQQLEGEYSALLAQLEAAGENALEAKSLDLKAKLLGRMEVQGKRNGSGSPFAAPVVLQKVSIARLGKPYKPAEIMDKLTQAIGARGPDDALEGAGDPDMLANMLQQFNDPHRGWGKVAAEKWAEQRRDALTRFQTYSRSVVDEIEKPEDQAAQQAKLNANKDRWINVQAMLPIGRRVVIKTATNNLNGIVLDVKQQGSTKNPLALGSWKATFAIADASRQIILPFSRMFEVGKADPNSELDIEIEPMVQWYEPFKATLERYQHMQSEAREERWIAGGNILSAYDWLAHKGAIINYTSDKGTTHQGILTARGFDPVKQSIAHGKVVKDPAQIKAYVDANAGQSMQATDGNVSLMKDGSYARDYTITAQKSKSKGGIYYLDKQLTKLTGDFVSKGGNMVAYLRPEDFANGVARLQELGAKFKVAAEKPKMETGSEEEESLAEMAPTKMLVRSPEEMEEIKQAVLKALRHMVGDKVAVEFTEPRAISEGENEKWGGAGSVAIAAYYPMRHLIQLSLTDGLDSTVAHEAYHAIEYQLQTPVERELMERETPRIREWIKKNNKKYGLKPEQFDRLSGEEVRAIGFEDYAKGRMDGLHIGVKRWYQKLLQMLRRLANALRGLGYRTYEDIFGRAYEGGYANEGGITPRPEAYQDSSALAAIRPGGNRRGPPPMSETIADHLRDRGYDRMAGLSRKLGIGNINTVEARTRLQDKMIRVRNAERSVGNTDTHLSAYQAESLYYGRTGQRLEQLEKQSFDPLIKAMHDADISLGDINAYLYARHAPERNAYIDTINPNLGGAGSGLSDADAAAIMAAIPANKIADYERIAAMVDRINADTRDTLVAYGLVSQETADEWNAQYQHYVPLRGFAEGTEDEELMRGRFSGGYDTRGKDVKAAFGRKSEADGPLQYVMMQAESAIVRGEKNRVGNTFLRFIRANPDPDRWQVNAPTIKRKIDPRTGLVTHYADFNYHNEPDAFVTKIGGKPMVIRLYGKDGLNIARALKTMGSSTMNGVVKVLHALTSIQSRLSTQWNPNFMIPNFARDLGESFINLQEQEQHRFVRQFVKHLFPAMRGAFQALAGGGTSRYANAFREFDKAGGRIRFFGLDDPDDIKRNISRKMRKLEGGAINNTLGAMTAAGHGFEIVNGAIENAPRLAAFMAARDVGISAPDAAMMARNLTVDFNKKGEWGPTINSLYMFANANIQGGARLARGMLNKRVRRGAYALAAMGVAGALYNYLAGGDDEDGEAFYGKIKPYIRDKNLIVMWPKGFGHDGKYIKVPLPYGFAPFHVIGDRALGIAMGKDKVTDSASAFLSSIADAFNPLGDESSPWMMLVPSLLRPGLHIAMNKNWTGGPIYPDNDYNKTRPNSEKAFRSNSDFSKATARELNSLSGGSPYQSGWLDFHPGSIDHILETITGGLGKFVMDVVKTGGAVIHGDPFDETQAPILRRFVGSASDPIADNASYYAAREEARKAGGENLKAARTDLRSGKNREEAESFIENNRRATTAQELFKQADKQMKPLRDRLERVEADQTLSAEEKRQQRNDITERMRSIQNNARKRYKEMRDGIHVQ